MRSNLLIQIFSALSYYVKKFVRIARWNGQEQSFKISFNEKIYKSFSFNHVLQEQARKFCGNEGKFQVVVRLLVGSYYLAALELEKLLNKKYFKTLCFIIPQKENSNIRA